MYTYDPKNNLIVIATDIIQIIMYLITITVQQITPILKLYKDYCVTSWFMRLVKKYKIKAKIFFLFKESISICWVCYLGMYNLSYP